MDNNTSVLYLDTHCRYFIYMFMMSLIYWTTLKAKNLIVKITADISLTILLKWVWSITFTSTDVIKIRNYYIVLQVLTK